MQCSAWGLVLERIDHCVVVIWWEKASGSGQTLSTPQLLTLLTFSLQRQYKHVCVLPVYCINTAETETEPLTLLLSGPRMLKMFLSSTIPIIDVYWTSTVVEYWSTCSCGSKCLLSGNIWWALNILSSEENRCILMTLYCWNMCWFLINLIYCIC